MPVLQAKVKSVLSGDTLILTNPRGLERQLSLAYISAPRLKREGDEVCLTAFSGLPHASADFNATCSHSLSSHETSYENFWLESRLPLKPSTKYPPRSESMAKLTYRMVPNYQNSLSQRDGQKSGKMRAEKTPTRMQLHTWRNYVVLKVKPSQHRKVFGLLAEEE